MTEAVRDDWSKEDNILKRFKMDMGRCNSRAAIRLLTEEHRNSQNGLIELSHRSLGLRLGVTSPNATGKAIMDRLVRRGVVELVRKGDCTGITSQYRLNPEVLQ